MTVKWLNISDAVILTEPGASPLVEKAAAELRSGLERVCGISLKVMEAAPGVRPMPGKALFIVGNINNHNWLADLDVKELLKNETEEDAYCLHTLTWKGSPALLIGGRGDRAVLYAAYELLKLYGIRFFMTSDVFPAERVPFRFPDVHLVRHPAIATRGAATILNFLECTVGWSLEDYRRHFEQMIKLRYNTYKFMFYPDSPWFGFHYRGIQEGEAHDLFTEGYEKDLPQTYNLDVLPVCRERLGRDPNLGCPALRGLPLGKERCRQGQAFMQEVVASAARAGLRVVIGYSLRHVAKALAEALPPWTKNPSWLDVRNDVIVDIVREKVRQCVKTFPQVDTIVLWRDEWAMTPADAQHIQAYQRDYEKRFGVSIPADAARGDLETLHLLERAVIQDDSLRRDIAPCRLAFSACLMPDLLPTVDAMLPKDMTLVSVQGWSTWPQVMRMDQDYRRLFPKHTLWIWTDMGHDVCGWQQIRGQALPQNDNCAFFAMVNKMKEYGLDGIIGNQWRIHGYEHMAGYLAELLWDPSYRPEAFYRDFAREFFGLADESSQDKMIRCFLLLDDFECRLMRCGHIRETGVGPKPNHWPFGGAVNQPTDLSLLAPNLSQYPECFNVPSLGQTLVNALELIRDLGLKITNPAARDRFDYFLNRLECGVLFRRIEETFGQHKLHLVAPFPQNPVSTAWVHPLDPGQGLAYEKFLPKALAEKLKKLPPDRQRLEALMPILTDAERDAETLCRLWAKYLVHPDDRNMLVKLESCVKLWIQEVKNKLPEALSLLNKDKS